MTAKSPTWASSTITTPPPGIMRAAESPKLESPQTNGDIPSYSAARIEQHRAGDSDQCRYAHVSVLAREVGKRERIEVDSPLMAPNGPARTGFGQWARRSRRPAGVMRGVYYGGGARKATV